MSGNNNKIHMVTFLLLAVGGLNWGLIGLFDFDVVALLGSTLARIVYVLVGLSAVYELVSHKSSCKNCKDKSSSAPSNDNNAGQMNMGGGQ